jgi:phosphoenolpyruvate synthase/pyruvate phosphate dikinase
MPSESECLLYNIDACRFSGQEPLLKGIAASIGCVRASVKIVRGPNDRFEPGQILVTERTDTSYIQMIAFSAGIITDIGGYTSHAAVCGRQYDKPCVVGTEAYGSRATERLKDGDIVALDSCHGYVYA